MQPSPVVQAALKLDETFSTLESLAGSIGRLELASESSHDKARQLLTRFADLSEQLGPVLLELSEALNARRAGVEQAVKTVAERAPQIQTELAAAQAKYERLQALGLRLQQVTREAQSLGPILLKQQLLELGQEAEALQEEARASRLKGLEREVSLWRKSLKKAMAPLVH